MSIANKGSTKEEIREFVHEYYLQPYGTRTKWLASKSVSDKTFRQWRLMLVQGDIDRRLNPREPDPMGPMHRELSAFEKARAKEVAEHRSTVEQLEKRHEDTARSNDLGLVFASSVGTIRDPNGFRKQWREVREALGYDWVTPHTFRKSVGTILANTQGIAAATAQLGHSNEKITSKHYVQKTHEAPDNTEVLQAFGERQKHQF